MWRWAKPRKVAEFCRAAPGMGFRMRNMTGSDQLRLLLCLWRANVARLAGCIRLDGITIEFPSRAAGEDIAEEEILSEVRAGWHGNVWSFI